MEGSSDGGEELLLFLTDKKSMMLCGMCHNIMTADCRDDKDIKKQFRRQNAVGNMLVRKFSFAPIEAKIQLFKSYCYPIYGCALSRHSFQNSIRKLTVSYIDTFNRLINVPRYISSSLSLAMNPTDHINECSANLPTA